MSAGWDALLVFDVVVLLAGLVHVEVVFFGGDRDPFTLVVVTNTKGEGGERELRKLCSCRFLPART